MAGRKRRRGLAVERRALEVPLAPNEVWPMDFVSDIFECGRRLKCLTIIDATRKKRSTSRSIMASRASK